ncbi:site-specific integrase [Leptolyngbya sp. FACHB-261]|uniref:site-specific integrase n=1 Tax=Leptolyngbya sp. FACHB-261 TaxID=2692806 RepID=UPI001F557AB0|nr:site-specific integrase [Leptolyngbya sp. FACHB-261]
MTSVRSSDAAFEAKLLKLNQRLKAARLGFVVEQRGNSLVLRGTLPPRPGTGRLRPYQQRLSLSLAANADGLKQAEQAAKVIAAQLIQKTFDWQDYLKWGSARNLAFSELTVPQQVEAFERWFFNQRGEQAASRSTWATAYAPYLRQVLEVAQAHADFSISEVIYSALLKTPPDSRSRQVCSTALRSFCQFLKLEVPFEVGESGLGYQHPSPRNLPDDQLIIEWFERIPNPQWRFVYGLMAAYGLRNHEVFFCDFAELRNAAVANPTVQVLTTTKTGEHEVWPFYPEWVEQFQLRSGCLPPVKTDLTRTTLQQVGATVTRQFRRYDLPFSPYDLRHAWAVRTIHFGLSDTVAARMMGHSVAIHTRTYHRWLARRDQQQAVETALARSGLKPPVKPPIPAASAAVAAPEVATSEV